MRRRDFLRTAGGAAGAASVAAGSAAAADGSPERLDSLQEDGTGDGAENGADGGAENGTEGEGGGGGGGGTETIMAGTQDQGQSFVPDTIEIAPGTTVRWEWGTDNHNVNPQTVPEDADWEGHQDIESAGFEYEHTFDVLGTYEYHCDPHAPDMAGTIEVTEDPSGGGDGGGQEELDPAHMGVPIQKHFVGIAAIAGIFSTLVFTFYVLKYGESPHTSAPGKED